MTQPNTSSAVPPRPTKKQRKADGEDSGVNGFWSILSDVKSRDKGKARADPEMSSPSVSTVGKKGKNLSRAMPPESLAQNGHDDLSPPKSRLRKRPPDELPNTFDKGQDRFPPHKKLKLDRSDMPLPESVSAALPHRTPRKTFSATEFGTSVTPPPSITPVRRVKLIVRKPPPVYSHPRQRPNRPQHGSSVTSALSSYTFWGDNVLSLEQTDTVLSEKTNFWSRVDQFRREGRLDFLPYLDSIDETTGRYVRGSTPNPKRKRDMWDDVVDDVVNGKGRPVNSVAMAGEVAMKVDQHWQTRRPRVEQMQVPTNPQALAKYMADSVLRRWMAAVLVSTPL